MGNSPINATDLFGLTNHWIIESDKNGYIDGPYERRTGSGIVEANSYTTGGGDSNIVIQSYVKVWDIFRSFGNMTVNVYIKNYYVITCDENGNLQQHDKKVDPPLSGDNGLASWSASAFIDAGIFGLRTMEVRVKPSIKYKVNTSTGSQKFEYDEPINIIKLSCVICQDSDQKSE